MIRSITNSLVFAALTAIAAACTNPVRPEHHTVAGGIVMLDAGSSAVLAQAVGATQPFDNPITLDLGTSLEVEILFLDATEPTNLDRAFPPDTGEGESVRVTIDDEGVVTYHDHGVAGDFEPQAVGQTTATIELMHGDHAEFRNRNLTIIVQ